MNHMTWELTLSFTALLGLSQFANSATSGPLIQVSGDSPFAFNDADHVAEQQGTNFVGSEVEPYLVVNPVNRQNIVGFWQQDRWSNGGARSNVIGVSMDGGETWEAIPLPGGTLVTGAIPDTFNPERASDPWLAFTPAGDLFALSLILGNMSIATRPAHTGVIVNKSSDGGLTWDEHTTLVESITDPPFHDKGSITADPTNPDFVYAIWDAHRGPTKFTRTMDAGKSWEPVRDIYSNYSIGHQIRVTPSGHLIDVFLDSEESPSQFSLIRSTDQGEIWSSPIRVAELRHGPSSRIVLGSFEAINADAPLREPVALDFLRAGGAIHDVSVDPFSGNLYVVWNDARFREPLPLPEPLEVFAADRVGIAFSMSTDGGWTWTDPVQIDQTPTDIDAANQQSFLPSIAVADDGTLGVMYYDFRNNTVPDPGLDADVFLVQCRNDCDDRASWRDEVRLTDTAFDFELAPFANGLFVGDYQGLATDGNDFLAFFSQPHAADPASVFFRRVQVEIPEPAAATLLMLGALGLLPLERRRHRRNR